MLDAVEERGERRVVGHVDADAEGVPAELGGHLSGEIAVEIADGDPSALMRQRSRSRVADAARPTGDRDDLVGQRARLTPSVLERGHDSAYIASISAAYLAAIALRLSFDVGVSSSPSATQSRGSTVKRLICSTRASFSLARVDLRGDLAPPDRRPSRPPRGRA